MAYFTELAPRIKGAMVFVGPHTRVPFQENPPAKRQTDEQARARYRPAPAVAGRPGRRTPRWTRPSARRRAVAPPPH